MPRHLTSLLMAVLFIASAVPAAQAVVLSIRTVDSGNQRILRDVTVDHGSGPVRYTASQLIGVDLTHFFSSASAANVLTANGDPVPAVGTRDRMIEDDALNTGIINPGQGTGISAAPTATTNGMGLSFLSSVVNRAGDDIIIIEFDPAAEGGDAFVVSALDFTTPGLVSSTVAANTWDLNAGSARTSITQTVAGGTPGTLAKLQANALSGSSSTQNAFVHGIDLSDLNYAAGASTPGIFIQGADANTPDPTFVAGLPVSASPGLTALTTTTVGNKQLLSSITVDRGSGPQTIAAADLINVTVVHFNAAGADNTSVLAVGVGDPDPAPGTRAALLQDLALNTGLVNPGTGTGLTADPTAATQGLGVIFNTPVLNAPGIDVIIVELDNEANGDGFAVSPLLFNQPGLRSVTFAEGAGVYDVSAALLNFELLAVNPLPTTLAGLEGGAVSDPGGNPRTGFSYFALGLDLSLLGYAEGDLVTGLFFQSTDAADEFDPVLIVAINSIGVPEPASMMTLLLAAGAASLRRRRRA